MKSLIKAIAVAAAVLAVPAVSFAQSTVTRAQVQAELAQVRGVHPSLYDTGDAHYPDGIQHAEAAAVAQSGAAVTAHRRTVRRKQVRRAIRRCTTSIWVRRMRARKPVTHR
jgi:hypothetical protein